MQVGDYALAVSEIIWENLDSSQSIIQTCGKKNLYIAQKTLEYWVIYKPKVYLFECKTP